MSNQSQVPILNFNVRIQFPEEVLEKADIPEQACCKVVWKAEREKLEPFGAKVGRVGEFDSSDNFVFQIDRLIKDDEVSVHFWSKATEFLFPGSVEENNSGECLHFFILQYSWKGEHRVRSFRVPMIFNPTGRTLSLREPEDDDVKRCMRHSRRFM